MTDKYDPKCAERGGGCCSAHPDKATLRRRALALYREFPEGARGLAQFNAEARAIDEYAYNQGAKDLSMGALKEVAQERGYHWDAAAKRFYGDLPLAFGVDSPARCKRGRGRR